MGGCDKCVTSQAHLRKASHEPSLLVPPRFFLIQPTLPWQQAFPFKVSSDFPIAGSNHQATRCGVLAFCDARHTSLGAMTQVPPLLAFSLFPASLAFTLGTGLRSPWHSLKDAHPSHGSCAFPELSIPAQATPPLGRALCLTLTRPKAQTTNCLSSPLISPI